MKSEIERIKKLRWIYLVVAILLFLFLGMSYGWSIFRGPLEEDFGWSKSQTSLAFTILGPMLGGGDFLRTFYMIAVFTGIGFIANIFIRVKK
ncbi:MAG: hypothetical protein IJ132_04430 [Firmicutes bacterium]|nr:hypothetical protein [Bacillota bacterium]